MPHLDENLESQNTPAQQKIVNGDFAGALLELGRNWALAVAIAGAGLAVHIAEHVSGPEWFQKTAFNTCIVVAMFWLILSTIRFISVAFPTLPKGKGGGEISTKAERYRNVAITATICVAAYILGACIIISIAHLTDNRRIVEICTEAKSLNNPIITNYDECKRLYKKRLELIERLEGKAPRRH